MKMLFVLQIYLQEPSDVFLYNYVPHHAWELHSTAATRNVQLYHCCPEPYMDVTYQFELRRRPGFFRDLYIIPALLMASLVPFIFALPVTRVHRYVLGEEFRLNHYSDVTISITVSQITSVSIVCSAVCSGAHQRKHRSFALLAFVRGIHRSPHVPPPPPPPSKRPAKRKMFPFDDVIMSLSVSTNKPFQIVKLIDCALFKCFIKCQHEFNS